MVYTWLRPSKAKRSYEKSFKLLELGINVPEPIAYIEQKKGLFFHTGYYICKYVDYRAIDDFVNFKPTNFDQFLEIDSLLREVASLAAQLHLKGVIHNDFNKDNILYKRIEEDNLENKKRFEFCLIDLNRVKVGCNSLNKAAKDLSNIHLGYTLSQRVVEEYCKIRALNPDTFAPMVLKHSNKYLHKSLLKDIFLTPIGLRKHRTADGYKEKCKKKKE